MKEKSRIKFNHYRWLYVLVDLLLTFGISLLTFVAFYKPSGFYDNIVPILIYSGALAIATPIWFFIAKVYHIITKNIGITDTLHIMVATLIIQIVGLVVISFVPSLPRFTDYISTWILSTSFFVFTYPSVRVLVRIFNIATILSSKHDRVPTIVIGAGAMGKIVIDESRRNKDSHQQILMAVDNDPNKIGGIISGVPIKGPISQIDKLIDYTHAQEVVIAISDLSKEELHNILTLLRSCNVRVRRMPLLSEMQGPNDRRMIDVDIEDLLSRDPVILDNHEIKETLYQKTVLVTGAGGSIGSELVRQIFKTHPKTLILFDIYENSTYDIQMELVRNIREEKITDINLVVLIGSTYNDVRVEQIFKKYKPDFVYHAAAYKHVPLMEDSPMEAIRTNVIGTYNVAFMADKYKAKKMVLVSTDKAVRPTNVMGATKRFAEMIIQHFSTVSKDTKYAAVRFGNVLGSNGSVVPLFKKQIEAGGPVTLTDKKITRFFMTIPEAVSLILQCGLFAKGGEIFILDMGEPVRIYDLACKLIRQAGKIPDVDIEIVETGLRPGEKLYEEILLDVSKQQKTKNRLIYIEQKEVFDDDVDSELKTISKVFDMDEPKDIKELLKSIVKTYKPKEEKEKE